MTRTFIALEMNEALQRHLAEVIGQVAQLLPMPQMRWVDPKSIHLTLAFLGELTDEQLAQAMKATEIVASQAKSFSYRLSNLGIFGSARAPRVFWIGIEEPTGSLINLHRLLNEQLQKHGFSIETRPFSPHLTLARIKSPLSWNDQQQLQYLLINQPQSIISTISYPMQSLEVMKSDQTRQGTFYSRLRSCVIGPSRS